MKRDTELLARVPVRRAREVLVGDISLARNRAALEALLAAGARVRLFDHHDTGGPLLPDAAWSRRIAGSLANERANAEPGRSQAVLIALPAGGHRVSVRVPLARRSGAAALCRRFAGSGREAAAGIDRLSATALGAFVEAFDAACG